VRKYCERKKTLEDKKRKKRLNERGRRRMTVGEGERRKEEGGGRKKKKGGGREKRNSEQAKVDLNNSSMSRFRGDLEALLKGGNSKFLPIIARIRFRPTAPHGTDLGHNRREHTLFATSAYISFIPSLH